MAQDKIKKENMKADKALDSIAIDPVTGQPGDLYGAPDKPSEQLLEDMEEERTGVPQDPALDGTGQPGELYGAPEGPTMQEQKYDEAKREASKKIAPMFSGMFWLRSISSDIELKPFSPSIMAKKLEEE
tara:strand:+ start:406 stop:792 length:387 start_codon:yes stop_codon:yes gene_type:complete